VHVGLDVDRYPVTSTPAAEQQFGTLRTPKPRNRSSLPTSAASPSRVSRNACRGLRREPGFLADIGEHSEVADVGATFEVRTEDARGHVCMAAFGDRELHQAMRSEVLGSAPSFLEMEFEAQFAPGLGQALFRERHADARGRRSAR
jgi:hypothetical protein